MKGRSKSPAVPHFRGERLSPTAYYDLPDLDDSRSVRSWLKTVPRPWAVDLFSGAGGLGLGLHDAGINVVVAAEQDEAALETHVANLGSLPFRGDLSNPRPFLARCEEWGISKVEVVAGGPPCQPFSRAGSSKIRHLVHEGNRPEKDPRTALWASFLDVIDALEPKVVLFENVPDVVNWENGQLVVEFMKELQERGFHPDAQVLEAFKFGVPQHRARFFLVAARRKGFVWPKPDRKMHTLRDAIGDLPRVGPDQRSAVLSYQAPKTPLQKRLRRGVPPSERHLIHDHVTRSVRPDDAEAFSLMKPGDTYKALPAHLRRYRTDSFDDKYKRLSWNALSRTITAHIAKDAYWYIHPAVDRFLSIREAARVQTFPDWFRFAGHPSSQLCQIGNAVPPLLAERLGRQIRMHLETKGRKRLSSQASFAEKLRAWEPPETSSRYWRSPDRSPWEILSGDVLYPRGVGSGEEGIEIFLASYQTPSIMVREWRTARSWGKKHDMEHRVRKLENVARVLIKEHGGTVPSNEAALNALPHVGEQTSRAILAFGFQLSLPLVTTGAVRVLNRYKGLDLNGWKTRLQLLTLAGGQGPDPLFNWRLDQLADTICTKTQPICDECPVAKGCEARITRK